MTSFYKSTGVFNYLSALLIGLLVASGHQSRAQTPYPIASGTYQEDFAGIGTGTGASATGWTDNFAAGTGANRYGAIPTQTVLPNSTKVFVAGSTGGVQKGAGSIALLATGTTDGASAAAFDLYLDFTGATAGTISLDWAEVNNSTGNRQATFKLQTNTGDGGAFVDLPQTSVVVTNGVASSGSLAAIALPAAFSNNPGARVRFYLVTSAGGTTGSRPKISLDNVVVTGAGTTPPAPAATIATGSVAPTSFCVTSAAGSPSFSVPFTTTGTLGGPYSVQLSDANGAFAGTTGNLIGSGNASPLAASIPAGTVSGTGYRVRVLGSNPATTGTDNGQNLTVSLTAATNSVTVTPADAQNLTTTGRGALLAATAALANSTYTWQYGTSASGPYTALAGATGNTYQVQGADFPGAGTYYLVAQATAATSCGSVAGTSTPVTITVTDPAPTPVITVSAATLTDFGSVAVGASSLLQSFTVSGTGLTGNLTMTPPAGFEIRLAGGAFACCPLVLAPSSGTLGSTTIEVRFVPTAAQAYAAAITVTGSDQPAQSVAVSGTGSEPAYPATLSTAAVTDLTGTTATAGGTIATDGGSAVTARGVVWSKTANPTVLLATKTTDGSGPGRFGSAMTGLVPGTTYYLRAYATNGVGTTYGQELSFSTVAVPLAQEPAAQATVAQGTLGSTSVQLLLGGGPSQKRLVLARLGSAAPDAQPTDATTYTANATFGSGQALVAGTFVVYNGTDAAVTVSNLRPNTPYSFAVYAFNDNDTPYAENYLATAPATLSLTTPAAPTALLLEENFDYPTGAPLTANNWVAHSGAGNRPVSVVAGSLAQAGYGPNSGNAAALTGSGEDVNRQFAPVYARTPTYAAFLVKVGSVSTTGDYFLHLGPQTVGSTFRGRVYARRTASGKVQFGTSSGSGAATYTSAEYELNSTNLLVLRYLFDEAGNSSALFINPTTDTEPATADALATETGTTPAAPNDNIGSVALRQGTNSPGLVLDGLRVGNSYRVVKTGLTCLPPAPAFAAAPVCVGTPTAFADASTTVEAGATYGWDVNGDGTVDFTTTGSFSYTYPAAGTYSATLTITQGSCSETTTQQVVVRALPTATLSGAATVCAGTAATLPLHLTGLAPWTVSYAANGQPAATLTVTTTDLTAEGNYPLVVRPSATTTYTLTAVADANCTGATPTGSATVSVNTVPVLTVPTVPVAATQAGQRGALVSFAATATGSTPAPTISYSAVVKGMATTITSPYLFPVGSTIVTATATNDCGTTSQTFTVTVQNPTLVNVLYQNADYLAGDNAIRPNLQLVNATAAAIPYRELTVRYWLTAEDFTAVQAAIDYAQLGNSGVKARYVALAEPAQGALGYVEYSFTAAGSLGAGANSGVIQSRIYKQDYSLFDETNDYSYGTNRSFANTGRLTVYRNGVLVGGIEPVLVPAVLQLQATSQNLLLVPYTNTLSVLAQVRNVGNVAVPYQDLTVRYWFTPDGAGTLKAAVDYAKLGNGNVSVTFGQAGTETYAELRFAAGLGSLAPLSATGPVQYRLYKSNWSFFTQTNDYSYRATGLLPAENPRITIYQQGQLVYGQEPAGALGAKASALRLAEPEATNSLTQEAVFEAFPNPFADRTALHFRTEGSGPARLTLYNALGQVVKTLFDGATQPGQDYGVTLEATGLAPGVYLAQLQADGKTRTVRLVIAN